MSETIIFIGGFPVNIADVRGYDLTPNDRTVLLKNGMKLALSSEDRDKLIKALNTRAKQIQREQKFETT
jgi:hypothetical protein